MIDSVAGTRAVFLEVALLRDGLHLHSIYPRLECDCSGSVVLLKELVDVDVPEVTWGTVGAWTWSLESLGPSRARPNSERWCLCAMELRRYLLTLSYLTILLVLTGSWILVCRDLGSEKPIIRRRPLGCLRVNELRVLIVEAQIIK